MFLQSLLESSSCPGRNYTACGADLPSNFCCPTDSTACLPLASNTTAVCCPDGQSCREILPITCNIQLQNATAFPHGPIFTTALDDTLPRCGRDSDGTSTCCPFGYNCHTPGGGSPAECVLATDQSTYTSLVSASPASATHTIVSITASSLATPSTNPVTVTATPTPGHSGDLALPTTSPLNNPGIIALWVTLAGGSILGAVLYCWFRRHKVKRLFRSQEEGDRENSPLSHRPLPPVPSAAATAGTDMGWNDALDAELKGEGPGSTTAMAKMDTTRLESASAPPGPAAMFPPPLRRSGLNPFSPIELPATPVLAPPGRTRSGHRSTLLHASTPPPLPPLPLCPRGSVPTPAVSPSAAARLPVRGSNFF